MQQRLPITGALSPQLVRTLPRTGSRLARRPKHSFLVRPRPFQIQPVMIAPVLGGDSFKSASFEFRAVSNSLRNSVVGWWCEFFMFYVRMSDLDAADFGEVQKLLTGVANTLPTTASVPFYNAGTGSIGWVSLLLNRVVREYFRHERDVAGTFNLDGVPVAALPGHTWVDTLTAAADIGSPANDYAGRFAAYEEMRRRGLVTMTYREFLEMEGADVGPQLVEEVGQKRRPELIRFVREFVYPSITTDPVTGEPASLVQWLVRDTADKARYFDQPGFVLGVVCVRPKTYRLGQRTSGASLLNEQRRWMAYTGTYEDAPQERLVQNPGSSTQLIAGSNPTWYDLGALFTHGDQFLGFDPASPPAGIPAFAMPSATASARYPVDGTAIDGLFSSSSNNRIWIDGQVQLRLTSVVPDTTVS